MGRPFKKKMITSYVNSKVEINVRSKLLNYLAFEPFLSVPRRRKQYFYLLDTAREENIVTKPLIFPLISTLFDCDQP